MVKNLVVAPPQLGRISIGMTVERNGKKLPQKTDSIRVTGNAMIAGEWIDHPAMAKLKKDEQGKVREIPVRILFDAPDSNLQSSYSCFNTKGQQLCVGDGESAKRREAGKVEQVVCPGPEFCSFAAANRCKLYSRFTVGIDDGSYEANPTAGFVFRSTGWNSAKALTAQLGVFSASCGGKMSGFPAILKIRAKSSSMSMKSMFFYLDLAPQGGLIEAVKATMERRKAMEEAGVQWDQIESSVTAGLNASAFAEDGEDGSSIVQEFFSDDVVDQATGEILPANAPAEAALSEDDVQVVKTSLGKMGRSIASLNTWLGRPEDAPLATMGVDNFTKVKGALGIKPVVSDGAMAATA